MQNAAYEAHSCTKVRIALDHTAIFTAHFNANPVDLVFRPKRTTGVSELSSATQRTPVYAEVAGDANGMALLRTVAARTDLRARCGGSTMGAETSLPPLFVSLRPN